MHHEFAHNFACDSGENLFICLLIVCVYELQCIVVLSQEPLFDTSDLASLKSDIDLNRPQSPSSTMGRYGSVEISLLYDAPMRKMTVHVLQARGIPCRDKGQPTHTQVSIPPIIIIIIILVCLSDACPINIYRQTICMLIIMMMMMLNMYTYNN